LLGWAASQTLGAIANPPALTPPARPPIHWPIPVRWIPGIDALADQLWAVAYLLGVADGYSIGTSHGIAIGAVLGLLALGIVRKLWR
jgi:hypothetical protein